VLSRGASKDAEPVWVRWQAWAGLVPLAGYLVMHLTVQASALFGPHAHARLAALGALWLVPFELVFLYLPLGFHVLGGVFRVVRPATAPAERGGSGALGRTVQPLSGAVLLVFIVAHVLQFRVPAWRGELSASDYYPELCASLSTTSWGGVPSVALGYLLGLAAAALHGAQGLYHGALRLGWVAASRQRRWSACCKLFGVFVFGLGASIVIDLATGSVLIR
jgi:succinate dehydrogenase / fumarate reductase, cytochrome b subunit